MRLIDANALLAEAMADGAYGYVDAKQIADAPTIDAVPVIRCKDCRHNSLKRMRGNSYCDLGMGLFQLYDFCSLGERKDG